MRINPGDLFRHYRVIERVGEGGMGVVYKAHDTRLGRDVALKFMVRARPLDLEQGGRLEREARALAALNHPAILTIYDIGEADGLPFLVLEWMDGGALAVSRMALPMPISDFVRIASSVADALGAAHDRGIVHRDVKPGNVLLSRDGRVKLADFGLAKVHDPDRDATRTAGAVGTVAYMSPEQAWGRPVGPASDVFSFGVLSYELLTGKRPFDGDGPGAVLNAIMSGHHTAIAEARLGLPPDLAAAIERCLRPDPAARFENGNELARALRVIVSSSDLPLPTGAETTAPIRTSTTRLQQIKYCTTSDGMNLAYSTVGRGPLVVRVLGYFTHLEVEWEWPDLRRFWEELAAHHTVVRYDGRGMGLSDRYAGEFTEETRQRDLDAVLTACPAEQATLLGISEGGWTAATYAIQHPGRISHLVLYGAYRRGALARPGYDPEEDRALITLIRKGWGRNTPVFRQLFTSQYFRPDADPELVAHFNELQRVSTDAETAARYVESLHRRGDGQDIYRQISIPTLVIHSRDDSAVSADEGRLLASLVPGAELVLLPSGAHYFPTDTDVVTKAAGAIDRFLRRGVSI
jgi:pimeloyl-ACP methyl ester carboxylesterase